MGDLVRLTPRGFMSGTARCAACRHDWAATAPVGTVWLECPACGSKKGRFRHPVLPRDGTAVWVCDCGCDVFMLTLESEAVCIDCGTGQRF